MNALKSPAKRRALTGGWLAGVATALAFALPASGASAEPLAPAAIAQELRSFAAVGTLLHIAAHPDDENTQLITYFARGRGFRTAYLSLTRGDGGQNEIGPEFDEKLGVARTQELLAARRLDGGRQFFTRAIDFGFSKNAEETLQFWDRDQVLADVVRVIRLFRPDVIATRFSPGSSGSTHGHHTASGMLGVEAFKLAGDPKAYPEQLTQGLTVWQPKRVVLNSGGPGRGGNAPANPATSTVRVDIGGNDPVTGESFAAISGRSRGMHITQGFGNFPARGGAGGPNEQSFTVLGGDPAEKDIFDGVDTTWTRYPGGAEIGRLTAEAIAQFNTQNLAANVPAILAIHAKLAALATNDPVLDDKRAQLDRILQACLGLKVETTMSQADVVPGERIAIDYRITHEANIPVTFVEWFAGNSRMPMNQQTKANGRSFSGALKMNVPKDTPLTQPYWLREESAAGIARVADPRLIGTAENAPAFPTRYVFEVGGQRLVVNNEPVFVSTDAKGEHRRRIDVVAPVSLRFASAVSLFTPGATRPVEVEVVAARSGSAGELKLEVPAGWKATPASQRFKIAGVGEKARFSFAVTAPAGAAQARMNAVAAIDGQRFSNQRISINYAHIPPQLLQPPARARLVSTTFAIRGKQIGYLPGAGDDVASAIEQLGYAVTILSGADLMPEKLARFDAVVIGVRAFNERTDFAANLPGLFAYVENGGTVIAQYNRPNGLLVQQLGPYALSIAGNASALRVTDEKSPVTFLAPDHPVLNVPNKIVPGDFDGWLQERGAYFPSTWDQERYSTILAFNDPGEKPLNSSVLVAKHGKGHYVYTGLAFFRQLPGGVPGAYRLFANLVSLGKE